jgi:hypothetical protein
MATGSLLSVLWLALLAQPLFPQRQVICFDRVPYEWDESCLTDGHFLDSPVHEQFVCQGDGS